MMQYLEICSQQRILETNQPFDAQFVEMYVKNSTKYCNLFSYKSFFITKMKSVRMYTFFD